MKIFLSHSGYRSRHFAEFLKRWLPTVNSDFDNAWVDRDAIPPGQPWFPHLDRGLRESDAGIVCITPESAGKPWPVAEFVCLRKDEKLVIPCLAGDAEPSHLPGPMQAHQFVIVAKKEETWNLLKALAGPSCQGRALEEMEKNFEMQWPKLEKFLQDFPANPVLTFNVDCGGKWRTALIMLMRALDAIEEQKNTQSFILTAISKTRLALVALTLIVMSGVGAYALLTRIGEAAKKKTVPAQTTNAPAIWPRMQETNAQMAVQGNRIRWLEETNARLSAAQITVVSSNAELASVIDRLQQQLQAAENRTSKLLGITNAMQVVSGGETNLLLFLQPDETNLVSLLSELASQTLPASNNWLMFVPKNAATKVPLYAGPKQGVPAGTLEFGAPYKVVALLDGTNFQLQPYHSDPQSLKPWIYGWELDTNYVTLRIVTNDSPVVSWRFMKVIEPQRRLRPPTGLRVLGP